LPRPEPRRSSLRPVELESAEVKVERIIGEELRGLGWKEGDPSPQPKSDLSKLALAACLRRETILTLPRIAARLHMRTWKNLIAKLHRRRKANETPGK
jgi:hypothetical protein